MVIRQDLLPASSEWTLAAYIEHNETLRIADKELRIESDRRYAEVNVEREKALKIKETADRDALDLARDRQKEKDAQADALRDKTLSESGIYATNASVTRAIDTLEDKIDKTMGPILEYISNQSGNTLGTTALMNKGFAALGALVSLALLYIAFVK